MLYSVYSQQVRKFANCLFASAMYFVSFLMAHLHWTVAWIGLKLDGDRISGRRGPRMGRRRGGGGAPLMGG